MDIHIKHVRPFRRMPETFMKSCLDRPVYEPAGGAHFHQDQPVDFFHVDSEFAFGGNHFLADIATELFLHMLEFDVSFHVGFERKTFSANIARELLLAGMHQVVAFEGFSFEHLVTNI